MESQRCLFPSSHSKFLYPKIQSVSYLFLLALFQISSVQFSHSVVSNSLQPHGKKHTRPPCLSLTPGVYLNSCPLSQRCHPTIWSSVIPFHSHLQSLPASGSFLMIQLFASGGQSTEASALALVFPMNIQGFFSFRIDWFDLLAVQGTLKNCLQHHSSKA